PGGGGGRGGDGGASSGGVRSPSGRVYQPQRAGGVRVALPDRGPRRALPASAEFPSRPRDAHHGGASLHRSPQTPPSPSTRQGHAHLPRSALPASLGAPPVGEAASHLTSRLTPRGLGSSPRPLTSGGLPAAVCPRQPGAR
ncbi:unnamed protein product, partial [Lampetra fluviatilis]